MAVDCTDPGAVANAARCFECNVPPGMQLAVQTYLLSQIASTLAGTSTDPTVLVNLARCFECYIPPGAQQAVQAYLLCQIAAASGA